MKNMTIPPSVIISTYEYEGAAVNRREEYAHE